MLRNLIITLVYVLFALSTIGQNQDSIHRIGLTDLSQVNQGNSYVTFPTDIGNIEPLWFEGNLTPNFYLRESKNSRLMGVLTPQIIIRMYQERSYPVRTPSYMPQFTVYYLFKGKENTPGLTLYGRLAHHSNGQDNDFFLDDGAVNLKSGDFSTNYFETGFIITHFNFRLNAFQFFKTSFEVHPENWIENELEGIYSKYRWHTAFSIFKLPANSNQNVMKKATVSVKGEATWMFGEFNHWGVFSLDRLNLKLTFYYHPTFLEDIGLFVQLYHGLDYYNMYFNHKLDIIRFGLMTEKLRF